MLCTEDSCEVGLASGCDEELWPDLSVLVDALSQDEDAPVDCVLHGDDLALAVTECEVVVEEPPAELVGPHVLVSLRQDLAEGAGCEVAFGDEARFLCASEAVDDGVVFYHPTAVIQNCLGGSRVSEDACYVIAAEERFSIFCRDGANVVTFLGKGDDLVHQLFSFVELVLG